MTAVVFLLLLFLGKLVCNASYDTTFDRVGSVTIFIVAAAAAAAAAATRFVTRG